MYKSYYQLMREGHKIQEIADHAGISYETMRKGIYRYAKKNDLPTSSVAMKQTPKVKVDEKNKAFIEKTVNLPNGDVEVTRLVPSETIDSPDDLLLELGLDPEHWTVKESARSKWGYKLGKMQFSVRVRVTPKKVEYEQFELLEEILKKVREFKPEALCYDENIPNKKETLIIPLYDLHYSVPNKAYFDYFLVRLSQKMKETIYEEIVIILGGDSLEHDNFIFTTEAGTRTEETNIREDYDGLYQFLIGVLDRSSRSASKVRYINVRGNHSPSMDWAVSHSLSYMFPKVEFDIEPATLKAITIYDSFFGIEHGHLRAGKRDEQSIGYLFRQPFAQSQFHYILSGHYHSDKEFVSDSGTFMRLQFPSPELGNNWKKDNIFHSQFRGIKCLIVEEGEGITGDFYIRNRYL